MARDLNEFHHRRAALYSLPTGLTLTAIIAPLRASPLGQKGGATISPVQSRRLFLRTSVGLGLVQLLAACSPTPPAAPTAASAAKPTTAPAGAAAATSAPA